MTSVTQLPQHAPRPRRRRRPTASAPRGGPRAASTAQRATAEGQRAPLLVGRGRTPTASALADLLGWFDQEAALDGTPLRVVREQFAPPPTPQLFAPPPPLPLHEGAAHAALWARSHGRATRLLGLAVIGDAHALAASPAPIVALTADDALLRARPQLVMRLLAVLLRAGAWARQHPDEATRLLAGDSGLDAATLAPPEGPALAARLLLGLDEHRELAPLRAQQAYLRAYGFLERDVDLKDWIDPRPLAAARELLAAERTAWT